ncbi:MAG: hypothetical protein WBA68_03575 [Alteraurantiacibacter sp.]
MNKIALLSALPLLALAACGEEPAPEAVEAPAATPTPKLAPADEDLFKEVFATTCPVAEPVSTAVCRRGMGAPTASCEFGLGEDTALRHDATLEVDETGEGWMIADAEELCAEHDSHHVDI